MVTLTAEAKDKLRSLIAAEADPGAGLRVQVVPGGCSGFEYDLSLSADGQTMVAGGLDGVLRLWSCRRGGCRPGARPSPSPSPIALETPARCSGRFVP